MKLITDRTIEDVRAGNAKGYYTYGDLNRVERQVQMLTQLAKQADMHLELQICTDWGRGTDWFTHGEMARYLQNVRLVTERLGVTEKLPESMEYLDYEGANRIEKALAQAEKRLCATLQAYQMSGELFAGEENGI